MKEGTRANAVNNQVVVVTRKDSSTKVKGLDTLKEAGRTNLDKGTNMIEICKGKWYNFLKI